MFSLNYKKKRQFLLILVFGLISVLFARGLQLHLANKITYRIKLHAIPIAISVLYHHHRHDYTGFRVIELPFQGTGDTTNLIKDAISQDLKGDNSNYYWVADDRGFSDYVIASFYLFGPHLASMYYMWFVVLLISVSLFLISFHKKVWALGFLNLLFLGIYTAISTLALSSADAIGAPPMLNTLSSVALYETRFLDVLALVSIFHMMFLASRIKLFRLRQDGGALLGQIGVFIFLYHARSSLGWELMAVFLYCILLLCKNLYKCNHHKFTKKFVFSNLNAPSIVIGALCLSLVVFNAYKHIAYHPQYFAEMGSRTFWHNALMGLGASPALEKSYHLSISDFNSAQSVVNFAKESGLCTDDVAKQEPQVLLNSLGNWGIVDWVNYEHCAKKLFFNIVSNNPVEIIYLYTITKPLASLNILKMAMTPSTDPVLEKIRSRYGMKWAPFNVINMSFLFIILGLSFTSLRRMRKLCMNVTSILLIASFIPSVAFYPDILTEGGLITILPVGFYLILIMILSFIQQRLKHRSIRNITNQPVYDSWMKEKKLTIIIPAFNEEERIGLTISEVREAAQKTLDDFEIIVIDDGSTDDTYSVALANTQAKTKVIRQKSNQGVGAAFFLGLDQAKFPQLCLIPGDNAYHKVSIELLFSKCGLVPLVISYRSNMEERTPLRHVLSRVATLSLRILTGVKISDAHSLFLFPVEETRLLKVNAVGYGYHMEILSRLLISLQSYLEVPVLLNPRPDASSGVMKPKTLYILGQTLCRLMCLRILRKL